MNEEQAKRALDLLRVVDIELRSNLWAAVYFDPEKLIFPIQDLVRELSEEALNG